jgi:dienelactone hydrolase
MRPIALLVLCLAACTAVEITTADIAYADGDTALRGYLAKPAGASGPLPGVLVVHEWWGCNDYAKQRARELAGRGFAAFALDMYGEGKATADPKEAGAWAGAFYQDRALLLRRANAGLGRLKAEPGVDGTRLAAIGFCFGGKVCLDLARSGAEIRGVVSLHGGLKTDAPATRGAIRARILVLHGGADPTVPPADVAGFMEEMTAADASWRMEIFGGVLHAFTNPAAHPAPGLPIGYNAEAATAAIARTWVFLDDVLR